MDELEANGILVIFTSDLTADPDLLVRFQRATFVLRLYCYQTQDRVYLYTVKDGFVGDYRSAARVRKNLLPLLRAQFPSIEIEDSSCMSVDKTDAAKMWLIW